MKFDSKVGTTADQLEKMTPMDIIKLHYALEEGVEFNRLEQLYKLAKIASRKSYDSLRKAHDKVTVSTSATPLHESKDGETLVQYFQTCARVYKRVLTYPSLDEKDLPKRDTNHYSLVFDPSIESVECVIANVYQLDSRYNDLPKVVQRAIDLEAIIEEDLNWRKVALNRKRNLEMEILIANRKKSSRIQQREARERQMTQEDIQRQLDEYLEEGEEDGLRRRSDRVRAQSSVPEVKESREDRLKRRREEALLSASGDQPIVKQQKTSANNEQGANGQDDYDDDEDDDDDEEDFHVDEEEEDEEDDDEVIEDDLDLDLDGKKAAKIAKQKAELRARAKEEAHMEVEHNLDDVESIWQRAQMMLSQQKQKAPNYEQQIPMQLNSNVQQSPPKTFTFEQSRPSQPFTQQPPQTSVTFVSQQPQPQIIQTQPQQFQNQAFQGHSFQAQPPVQTPPQAFQVHQPAQFQQQQFHAQPQPYHGVQQPLQAQPQPLLNQQQPAPAHDPGHSEQQPFQNQQQPYQPSGAQL